MSLVSIDRVKERPAGPRPASEESLCIYSEIVDYLWRKTMVWQAVVLEKAIEKMAEQAITFFLDNLQEINNNGSDKIRRQSRRKS